MYIEKINQPTDVKNLNSEQLHILADEMRQALLQKLSKHGCFVTVDFVVQSL